MAVCLLGLLLPGCQRPTPVAGLQMISGRTMGTTYSIKWLPSEGQPSLGEISKRVQFELDEVNQQMSTYLPESELSQFNQQASTEWFEVSADTAEVVDLALEIHRQTDGAFDVTVGPLVDLWGFGPPGRPASIPNDEAIAAALAAVGSDKVEVRLEPPAVRKLVPQLRMDLSAIAKGHGVDRVADVLDAAGIENYFVEIGGEVRTRGARHDGQAWQVGIEQPNEGQRRLQLVLGLSGMSLATSGDYRNFYSAAGQRISHFIDPKTGQPIMGEIASASVIADNCAEADGLATGLMSLGFSDGLQRAEREGWAVLLIARQNDQFVTASTPEFDAYITEHATEAEGTQP